MNKYLFEFNLETGKVSKKKQYQIMLLDIINLKMVLLLKLEMVIDILYILVQSIGTES